MVTKLVYGGIAAAGLAGGFLLDRSISDTPYRVDKRLPDIARPEERDDYGYDSPPPPAGGGVNAAVLWGPIGGAVVSAIGVGAARTIIPRDRVWQQTFAGRGAIAATVIGASMATGALVSRSTLG
jgi:hypothetical protein